MLNVMLIFLFFLIKNKDLIQMYITTINLMCIFVS